MQAAWQHHNLMSSGKAAQAGAHSRLVNDGGGRLHALPHCKNLPGKKQCNAEAL